MSALPTDTLYIIPKITSLGCRSFPTDTKKQFSQIKKSCRPDLGPPGLDSTRPRRRTCPDPGHHRHLLSSCRGHARGGGVGGVVVVAVVMRGALGCSSGRQRCGHSQLRKWRPGHSRARGRSRAERRAAGRREAAVRRWSVSRWRSRPYPIAWAGSGHPPPSCGGRLHIWPRGRPRGGRPAAAQDSTVTVVEAAMLAFEEREGGRRVGVITVAGWRRTLTKGRE
jgi:hypothetical protein